MRRILTQPDPNANLFGQKFWLKLTYFKQLEHKRAAENLLAARRERRSMDIAQKLAERDAEQKEAELKAKLVEEERQKLIAKHAQVGFQIVSRSWASNWSLPQWFDWL